MSGVYAPDGGWNITLVSQDDLPVSLYAPNGSIRVTTDTGRGVYAPNGSIRVQSITVPGIYNPNGNIQGVLSGSVFYPAWMFKTIPGAPPALDSITGTLPVIAIGWSKKLRSGYAGKAWNVVRPSDGANLDIGYVGNNLDEAALRGFLGSEVGRIPIAYNQGTAGDIVQITPASQPTVGVYKIGGSTAILFNAQFMALPAGLSMSSQAIDYFSVCTLVNNNNLSTFVQFGSGAGQVTLFQGPGNLGYLRNNPGTGNSLFVPQSRPLIYESSWGETTNFTAQGSEKIIDAAVAAATLTGGQLGNSDIIGGLQRVAYVGADIAYGRTLSAQDNTTLRAALAVQFGYTENPTGRLLFVGDSITSCSAPFNALGYGYALQTQALLSKPVNIYQLGAGGSLLNTYALPNYATTAGNILGQYTDNRVVFMLYGTNDLTIGGRTAVQIYGDIQAYCGLVHTSGGKIIVATITPNVAWNSTQIATQQSLNAMIRAGNGVDFDGLADFAADPTMGPQAASHDTTLYADGLHPTVLGHSYLAPIAAAAINPFL